MEYFRRKQSHIAVRHVSGDWLVAVVEVVSPGNKASRKGLQSFVEKVAEFLERRIHLLILDLLPPTSRDPQGIHGVIWEEITGEEYEAPAGEPLTLATYESAANVRAYIEPLSAGSKFARCRFTWNRADMCLCRLSRRIMRLLPPCRGGGGWFWNEAREKRKREAEKVDATGSGKGGRHGSGKGGRHGSGKGGRHRIWVRWA